MAETLGDCEAAALGDGCGEAVDTQKGHAGSAQRRGPHNEAFADAPIEAVFFLETKRSTTLQRAPLTSPPPWG